MFKYRFSWQMILAFIFAVLWIVAACVVHAGAAFKPTGTTAKNRYLGYLEAVTEIYNAPIPEESKRQALNVLLNSPKLDQYFVEISDN